MDIAKTVAELRQERERIEEAIVSLERLAMGRRKGPGRPPTWMTGIALKEPRRMAGNKSKPSAKTAGIAAVA